MKPKDLTRSLKYNEIIKVADNNKDFLKDINKLPSKEKMENVLNEYRLDLEDEVNYNE